MTLPEAFQIAVQHHQAGRLAEAEALYRQILAAQPNHAEALHYFGVIAHQVGRNDVAVEWIRRAIALDPGNPLPHSNLGEAYRAMGQYDEAIAACRRAIEVKPDFPQGHYNLGNALRERGQLDEAVAAYLRALELKTNFPEAHVNLGVVLRERGQLDEAVAAYRRALEFKPDHAEAHNNLGVALRERGQLDEAVAACRRALELQPDFSEAWSNLGNALRDRGQPDEAIAAFQRVVELQPGDPKAHCYLSVALRERGQLDDAMAVCGRALELKSDYPEAHNNLGAALAERGRLDDAVMAYRRALELQPGFTEAHINLGNALRQRGQLDEAVVAYQRALELGPDNPEALNNLGNTLKDQGELDEAIAAYRGALRVKAGDARAHSNLIYALHFHPGQNEKTIFDEHQRWNHQFSEPVTQFVQPQANERSSGRRLRIGYVSPDFRDHPMGRLVLPLFECHDRERFEIFCYSGTTRPDWMTDRFRALTSPARGEARGGWRNTLGVSDAQLAGMIREDAIDILVDLSLHTAGNRLPMFARRPAPVQVAWLGYPGGTGLPGIGYRLTDARLEPPREEFAWSSEQRVRLPDCWCCHQPAGEYPEINPLPALSAKGVTFGSLNNFAKVNQGVLALWARALEAVKGSRLVMLCPEGRTRERVLAFFGVRGIAPERLELVGQLARWEYLRLYQRIDVALDPSPYSGTTTTCEALWMGAPVLTLPGEMPASRVGLSILWSVGLAELAASSEEDYVRLAVELAGDLPRLADLRATLRERMLASPLMDAPRFARNVEAAYERMKYEG